MDTLINTSNLTKAFGNNTALNKLNMQVPKGIAGFIGRNGAGKTTTIGVLLGLIKPKSGEATVFGLDCWRDSYKIRKRLGVMHEVNAYPGGFSGKRFLTHVARIYQVPLSDRGILDALKDVGLGEAADRSIKTYSAGMFRRLGLAQALIGNPELAILDEPTANIDPFGRIAILEKIKQMHQEKGTSFLISTHILSDLEKVCSWLSIIDKGKIVDQGNVDDLAAKYSANIFKIEVSNPEALLLTLQTLGTVEKAWIEDGKVLCKVKDPSGFYAEIPRVASSLNLQLKSLQHLTGSLEEIYTRTVGGA